jgi:hypothetical protein
LELPNLPMCHLKSGRAVFDGPVARWSGHVIIMLQEEQDAEAAVDSAVARVLEMLRQERLTPTAVTMDEDVFAVYNMNVPIMPPFAAARIDFEVM